MIWITRQFFLMSCAGRRTLYETILITLHLGINQLYNDKLRVIPTKEEWAIKEQNYNMAEELIAKQAGRFFNIKLPEVPRGFMPTRVLRVL